MVRDPAGSYASETRQLGRQDRLSGNRGAGPPGLVVIAVILVVAAIVAYVVLRP